MNDHRRIAWRLSGRILVAQIVAFVIIDVFILLLILLYRSSDISLSSLSFLNEDLAGAIIWIRNIRYFDIGSVWVLVSLGVVQVLLIIGQSTSIRNSIREQLEPLRELRIAADAIAGAAAASSSDVGGVGVNSEAVRRLADAISHVEARDMNAHIAVESVSPELQPLLEAIKDMLYRLEAAYAAQTKFVADASHELRTPIAVVQGYANLLSRWGSEDPETLKESIEAIKSEAEMMKRMINQLLFLARGDNDTLILDIQTIDIVPIANEVIREELMLEQERIDQGILNEDTRHEIESRFSDEGGVFVSADPSLIKQLIRILIDNSILYSQQGGEILLSVTANQESGECKITVQDEGQGISADILPHIFDRFVRADEARTRNAGGSGLGLSIAKQIVKRHGGKLEVFSIEGAGSRFTVTLPLSQEKLLIESKDIPEEPDLP